MMELFDWKIEGFFIRKDQGSAKRCVPLCTENVSYQISTNLKLRVYILFSRVIRPKSIYKGTLR